MIRMEQCQGSTYSGLDWPQRPRASSAVLKVPYARLCLIFLCISVVACIGCASHSNQNTNGQSPANTIVQIAYQSSTQYAAVLATLTDLGLQPNSPCIQTTRVNGKITSWVGWVQGETNPTAQIDHIFASPTVLAPANWLDRLKASSGVEQVQVNPSVACSIIHAGTPPPGTPVALAPDQAGEYVRVTFISPYITYHQSLVSVSSLGFRLADICYEQKLAHGSMPQWHTMGQEVTFAATQTLLVATTSITSEDWADRLRVLAGTKGFESPVTAKC